jgi:hypothetical protein
MNWNQNFVLFPNIDLEMVCRFFFESSWGICERSKPLVWTANKQVLRIPISPIAKMLKISVQTSFWGPVKDELTTLKQKPTQHF